MTETLKPCPFCGGEAHTIKGDETVWVQCTQVKMHRLIVSGDNNAEAEAIAAWNRRTAPTPETLEAWAEWFDDPSKSPKIGVSLATPFVTPGYLLREIARRLRAAKEE